MTDDLHADSAEPTPGSVGSENMTDADAGSNDIVPPAAAEVNTLMDLRRRIEAATGTPAKGGDNGQWTCRCPAHDDRQASLSVTEKSGKLLLHCFAGCSADDICSALGLTLADLFTDAVQPRRSTRKRTDGTLMIYPVRNADGTLVAEHHRLDYPDGSKRMWWEREGRKGLQGLRAADLPLYRIHELLQHPVGATVTVTEGEKAADAVRAAGLLCVGTYGAEVIPSTDALQRLTDYDVVLWPDADTAGDRHMAAVARRLATLGVTVRRVTWPDAPPGGDAADADAEQIAALVEAAAVYEAPDEQPAPAAAADDGDVVLFDKADPLLHYTDSGLAERLTRLYGADLRHCWPRGVWYVWAGTHWQTDEGGRVQALAGRLPRAMLKAAADIDDPDDRSAAVTFALKSESERARNAAVSLARSCPEVPVQPDQLDANLWLLNVLNGTLNLRTGKLQPHRREDLCTRLAPVEYDPDIPEVTMADVNPSALETVPAHLLWQHFLDQSTGGDYELQRYLAQVAGMALTGDTGEEVFAFVYGPARSGKSTFLNALQAALGPYAHAADFNSFVKGGPPSPGGHRADLLALEGRRLAVAIETSKGMNLDVKLISQLTGGDVVSARGAYGKDVLNFKPQFTLFLAGNDRPVVDDMDEQLWERLREVPFAYTVPKDRRRPELKRRLTDPADGGPAVLAWAVRGCLDWQANGLQTPTCVERASEEYRQEVDPLRDFIADCCIVRGDARATAGALYEAYRAWCERNGIRRPMNNAVFGKRLQAKGYNVSVEYQGGKSVRIREGIGLLHELHES